MGSGCKGNQILLARMRSSDPGSVWEDSVASQSDFVKTEMYADIKLPGISEECVCLGQDTPETSKK